ncbi:hypothetical protein ES703_104663 [subsurface metagenome]
MEAKRVFRKTFHDQEQEAKSSGEKALEENAQTQFHEELLRNIVSQD